MVDLVLGIGAAVAASTLYSLGIALQAIDAKEAPDDEHLRLALAWRLVRRARWLLGTGLSILGWPLQIVALLLAPLVVVQPALAAGLLVLMFLAQRMLRRARRAHEHLAMAAIVIGVVGAGAVRAPRAARPRLGEPRDHARARRARARAPCSPTRCALSRIRRPSVTMVGAGLAGGWSGVATKLASDDLSQGRLGLAALGALDRGRLGGRRAQRDERAAGATGDPGRAGRVRDSDGDPDRRRAAAVRRELRRHAAGRRAAVRVAGAAGRRRRAACALAAAGRADGGRAHEPFQRLGAEPVAPQPGDIRSSPATDAGEPSSSTTSTSPARVGR